MLFYAYVSCLVNVFVKKDRGPASLFCLLINKDIPECSFGLIVLWLVVLSCDEN